MKKYIVIEEKCNGSLRDEFLAVFDTLEDANYDAEAKWNYLTAGEQKKQRVRVVFVEDSTDFLEDDAFGEDGKVDFTLYHSTGFEPNGFDSANLSDREG